LSDKTFVTIQIKSYVTGGGFRMVAFVEQHPEIAWESVEPNKPGINCFCIVMKYKQLAREQRYGISFGKKEVKT
jgi:hypothetical protein